MSIYINPDQEARNFLVRVDEIVTARSQEHWFDATGIGDPYEQQVSTSGKKRHRLINMRAFKPGALGFFEERGTGEWIPGPAPGR